MGSLIDAELQQGLAELEMDQADEEGVKHSVVWFSRTFFCSVGTNKRGNTIGIGGKIITFDFSCTIIQSTVAEDGETVFSDLTRPVEGNDIAVDGVTYTIEFVETAQDASVRLMLIGQNQQSGSR